MKHRFRLLRVALLAATLGLIFAMPAQAQFICAGSADGTTGFGAQGATADFSKNNVACGSNANASSSGPGSLSGNTAFGSQADAHGLNSNNVASGFQANASGDDSSN